LKRIDLNVDIGEGFAFDEQLLEIATSANVCCGEHAGSPELTERTIELCRAMGARIGMHPGFPDRESMGRAMPEQRRLSGYAESIQAQAQRFVDYEFPAYIKPHGAWYNALASPESVPAAVYGGCWGILAGLVFSLRVPVMLLACPRIVGDLEAARVPLLREGFADRAYRSDGTLVPRSEPGALLSDLAEIREQVLRIAPKVDSICLHGDTPGCVEIARSVRDALESARYEVGY